MPQSFKNWLQNQIYLLPAGKYTLAEIADYRWLSEKRKRLSGKMFKKLVDDQFFSGIVYRYTSSCNHNIYEIPDLIESSGSMLESEKYLIGVSL